MNAIEIRLSRPTASNPAASVTSSPIAIVTMIAATSFIDRVASHRVANMAASITPATSPILFCKVANSSSDSGTSPVRRTFMPCAASRFSAFAVACTAALASSPGISEP